MAALGGGRVALEPLPVVALVRRGLRLYTDNAGTAWRVLVPLAVATQLVGFIVTVAGVPAGST
jgi:5-enolpyruvylshikimate-3-phosphate synthase